MFGYKGLVFCRINGWILENMEKGLTVPKWMLTIWPKIPQMPQNLCISSGFQWKKASSGVGSPWYVATGRKWKCSNASFFKVSLALCWGSLIPDFTKNLDNRQKCHNMDKVFMKSQAIMFSSSIYFVLCYTHFGLFNQNFEFFFSD